MSSIEAGAVIVRIMADSTALTAGLGRASGQMAAFGTKMSKVGMGMTKYMTLPIVAAGVASVVMAASFEKSMTLIQTQAGGSAKDVEVLSKAVLGMKNVQHGPKELADSLYHLKSVGMDNVQAMEALKLAEQGASVGGSKLEETTNAIAGAWRTGIQGAQSFEGAMGTLNAIVGAGNLRMEDLNSALGTGILVSAKTFGVSLTSVGAALALFTSQGMPATQSATRLRMAISLMGAPTEKAAKLLQGIGIGATDMAKALREGGLVQAVGLLKDHMQGLSKIQQSTLLSGAFGGARTGTAIMALVDGYDTLVQKQKQIVANTGNFSEAVAAQAEDTEAKWKHFLAVLQTDAVKVGSILLPIASSLGDGLGGVADAFGNLSAGTQSFIVHLGLVVAAAGPVTFVLGKLISFGALAAGGIGTLVSTVGALTAAMSVGGIAAFGSTLAATLGPAGIVIGAIAGTAALAYGLHRLDQAFSGIKASAADYKNVTQKLQGPDAGKLQAAMNKALGGHYVVKAGELVWEPKTVDVSPATIVKAVHEAAAKVRAAKAEEAQKDLIAATKIRFDELDNQAKFLEATARMQKGSQPNIDAANAKAKAARAAADQAAGALDKMTGSLARLQGKDATIVIRAKISDLQTGVKKAQAQLDALTKKPQTAKVILQEAALKKQIERMRGAINDITKKNWKVIIEAKIDAAHKNIATMRAALAQLNKQKTSPKIEAQKKTLETAISQAKAHLHTLNAQKTNPTINANVQPALAGIGNVIAYLNQVQSKTVTVTVNTKSIGAGRHSGGIENGPHSGYPVVLHGREAILPLDHPNLIPSILARAGIGSSTAGRSAPGAVINNSVNVNVNAPVYGVDDLHNVIHSATMAAMEEAQVAEGRSARGMVR